MTFGMDRRWRRIAALAADAPAGGIVLDLGTGTGDLAISLARYGRAKNVIGADFSQPMLARARSKVRAANLNDLIRLTCADAITQPFADDTFDCLTQAFLIRNVTDPAAELAEIRRVLKPGGKMVTLELVRREGNLLSPGVNAWSNWIVPLLGRLVAGDLKAYRYLVNSAQTFFTSERLAGAIEAAGFVDVRWRCFAMGSVALHVARKPA